MNFRKTLLAVALTGAALAGAAPVAADPVFKLGDQPAGTTGLNDIELINRENLYRSTASCAQAPTLCLPATSNDPTGYRQVNVLLPNNIQAGDLFIGVYDLRNIKNVDTGTTWVADPISPGLDTFSGYFIQEVQDVAAISATNSRVLLRTPTVADPFGIVDTSLGESAALFVDSATAAILDGPALTVAQSVASATDGTLWATLGLGMGAAPGTALAPGSDADGYAYSEVVIGGGLQTFSGTFFTAYNLVSRGAAFNIGDLLPINDPQELTIGGSLGFDPLSLPPSTALNNYLGLCTATATYACNDVAGNGQLGANQNLSPWVFTSEDPLQLYAVPEPASLALIGLGLLGLGATRRRAVK